MMIHRRTASPIKNQEPSLSCRRSRLLQVQYWSDSKNRWMDAIVEGIRLKD